MLADVIAIVADVIATYFVNLAGVIATVADVITTLVHLCWLMLLPWWQMLKLHRVYTDCLADVKANCG